MKKNIKIQYTNRHTGNHESRVPKIQMEGRWLENIGFTIGSTVSVEYNEGCLLIRPLNSAEQHELEKQTLDTKIQEQTAILEQLIQASESLKAAEDVSYDPKS